jgi:hypothetical protein
MLSLVVLTVRVCRDVFAHLMLTTLTLIVLKYDLWIGYNVLVTKQKLKKMCC